MNPFLEEMLEYIRGKHQEHVPKCTCREDSKQRSLCPVCDKEEYDKSKNSNLAEKKQNNLI